MEVFCWYGEQHWGVLNSWPSLRIKGAVLFYIYCIMPENAEMIHYGLRILAPTLIVSVVKLDYVLKENAFESIFILQIGANVCKGFPHLFARKGVVVTLLVLFEML